MSLILLSKPNEVELCFTTHGWSGRSRGTANVPDWMKESVGMRGMQCVNPSHSLFPLPSLSLLLLTCPNLFLFSPILPYYSPLSPIPFPQYLFQPFLSSLFIHSLFFSSLFSLLHPLLSLPFSSSPPLVPSCRVD